MRKLEMSAVVVLGVMLVTTFVRAADQVSAQDVARATERAREFFQLVGWGAVGEYKTQPARAPRIGGVETTIGDLGVEVDPVTGNILSARNRKALSSLAGGQNTLSETVADEKARGYLRAAGLSLSDAAVQWSKITNYTTDPKNARWEVRFQRVYKGFAFYDDYILVSLDPASGGLLSFGSHFRSSIPDATIVKLPKEDAERIARDYLAGLGIQAGALTSSELKIVQPDSYWEYSGTGVLPTTSDSSRLAYVVVFNAPWEATEVWVDAENGQALGGVKSKSIPTVEISQAPITSAAQTVSIESSGQEGKTRALSAKLGTGQETLKAMSALRLVPVSECATPVTIELQGKDRSYTFGYSAQDHRLVLLGTRYLATTTKGNKAWETTAALESLLDKIVPSLATK